MITQVFSEIYEKNTWGNGSGHGSDHESCQQYLGFLKTFAKGRVLDVGCGDLQIYDGKPPFMFYTGIDVVPGIILKRKINFKDSIRNVKFEVAAFDEWVNRRLKIARTLNVVLMKDVLQHLPIEMIQRYLAICKELSTYRPRIIITNDFNPTIKSSNAEIELGQHRPLALMDKPFNLSPKFWFDWYVLKDRRWKQTIVI